MIVPVVIFSLVGLGIFYLQNLVFFPHVHLRLLSLLLFYVGLGPSLSLSLALSLVLGLLQDSYAGTPLGLHLGGALVLVAMARLLRSRLLLQRLGSQVMATLVALSVQEIWFQTSMFILGYQGFSVTEPSSYHGLEILGTSALAPLMYLVVGGLEKFLRRLGWRPLSEPSPYQM